MIESSQYTSDTQDVFSPDTVAHNIFLIYVGWDAQLKSLNQNRPIPDELKEQLIYSVSYVEEQIHRWGKDAIDKGLHEMRLPNCSWESIDEIFSSYHALFDKV